MIRVVFFVSALIFLCETKSIINSITVPPKGCEWQMRTIDEDKNEEIVVLNCQIRTINNAEYLIGNLTQTQTDRVKVLHLQCNDALFFESTFDTSKSGALLKPLKKLEELEIENCKIRNIPAGSMNNFRHLKKFSLQSHNSEWSAMSFELDTDSFRGLNNLKVLILTDNNLWNTPNELFCPLYGLIHLNLSSNKLQDIQSLGFSDWGNGPLEPGRACANLLETLDLNNNNFVILPDNGFSGLRSLQELYMQGNSINNLADRSFVGLTTIKTLNLSSNNLVAMPPELFQSSRQLMHLFLQNNSLSVLAPGLLEGLDQLRILDLSKNQLTSRWVNRDTFSGLIRLVILNLGYNQLNRVESNLFHDLYSLQVLNLENNLISIISEGAFEELKNLHSLTLSHNKISHIEANHFTGMYALNQLLMDHNEIEHIHPSAFENVTNLQDLDVNGNFLGRIPAGIGQLRFLKTLDLGKNQIEFITNSSFEGLDLLYGLRLVDNFIANVSRDAFSTLPSLQVLNLASNKIKYIEQSAFANNPTLKAIRLDSNELTDISGVFTNLENLMWLNVSSNNLLRFDFRHLPDGLEWLDMHHNEISELGNYFDVEKKNTLKIKMLDASFNLITSIHEKSIPDSVEILYLQHNKISSIAPNTFLHKINLEKVVLYGNDLRYLDLSALSLTLVDDKESLPQFYIGGNPFYCDCKMEWLLRINHLSNLRQYPQILDLDEVSCELAHSREAPPQPLLRLKPSNFLCSYQTHCFALCHCCEFDACDCEMTCPDRCSCFHDHTWTSNIVDCSNAGYAEVPEKIPMDATEIYLDGNDLGELGSHVFIGKKKLEILFLNNSNVRTLNNKTFTGAPSLKILHMENNQLEELRGDEFNKLENVKELYLDNNKINFLNNDTFNNMNKLEILNLNNNEIVNFIPSKFKFSQVSLEGNKWTCDCSTLQKLTSWIRTSNSDPKKMMCSSEEVSGRRTLADALKKCEQLDNTVSKSAVQRIPKKINHQQFFGDDHVSLVAATLASVIVVSLLVAVMFIFRQEVKLWAHSRYGVRIFQDFHQSNNDDNNQIYDCYMIYSNKDEDLARIVGPELESFGYSLCLHYRDLQLINGGVNGVTDAIIGAADASRRILFMVSPALFCAEWTKPEFRAALQTAVRNNPHHKLICILTGEPIEPMDPEFRALLGSCTITRWGERRFWDKLRYAMPDILDTNNIERNQKIVRQSSSDIHAKIPTDTWYKYQAMPAGVHNNCINLTPTPTQSSYVSGGDSNRSTEDESSYGSSQHYGSEQLNHSYVSIDGKPINYPSTKIDLPPHHVYSTIPDAPPQSRTYFV